MKHRGHVVEPVEGFMAAMRSKEMCCYFRFRRGRVSSGAYDEVFHQIAVANEVAALLMFTCCMLR